MSSTLPNIAITDLRGGMNDTDDPTALIENQCVSAVNVEFFKSMLGERRGGTTAMDLTSSGLTAKTQIVHLSQWFPTNDVTAPEVWAEAATPAGTAVLARWNAGTWAAVVPFNDNIDVGNGLLYRTQTQALGKLLFFAYGDASGTVARLHVWDGAKLRRTGLNRPDVPVVADSVAPGAYATTRYFRVRLVIVSGSSVLVRSEPGNVTTFNPSGLNTGAVITLPVAVVNADGTETHWEIEASTDNVFFYRIVRQPVGTTTYTDTTVFATGYASNPLSEAIGAYLLQPPARFLSVDGDRLILAGDVRLSAVNSQSTIWWSPVSGDPGVGNSERQPIVTTGGVNITTTLTLDSFDGGPITGVTNGTNGAFYVFKYNHIYRLVRTNNNVLAYDTQIISKSRGAIEGSVVSGMDEQGQDCIYFLDPTFGPSRISVYGVQTIYGQRTTWTRVNTTATGITARSVYYPNKQQVHWWVAVDGGNTPGLKIILQTNYQQASQFGESGAVLGSWVQATGKIATALAVCNFNEQVTIGSSVQLLSRPLIGLASPDYIQRCDTGTDDNGTAYVGTITTRAYVTSGLLSRWGAMTVSLLATATSAGPVLDVSLIRDLGVETTTVTQTGLAPVGSETEVVKDFDSLVMSGARMLSVKVSDHSGSAKAWALQRMDLKTRPEESN